MTSFVVTRVFDSLPSRGNRKIDLKTQLIKTMSLSPRGRGMQRVTRMTKEIRKARARLMEINWEI